MYNTAIDRKHRRPSETRGARARGKAAVSETRREREHGAPMNMLRRTERGNPRGALPGWMKRIGMASDDLTGKGKASRKVARGENLDNLTGKQTKDGNSLQRLEDTSIAASLKALKAARRDTTCAERFHGEMVFDRLDHVSLRWFLTFAGEEICVKVLCMKQETRAKTCLRCEHMPYGESMPNNPSVRLERLRECLIADT